MARRSEAARVTGDGFNPRCFVKPTRGGRLFVLSDRRQDARSARKTEHHELPTHRNDFPEAEPRPE